MAEVRDCLMLLNVCSNSSDYVNSFLVCRSGRRGARSVAMVEVLDESWFTRPIKERRPVRLEGVRKLGIASVIEGSIRYPSEER